jgi:triacylglycerol esterase/lipase EstA (alpha/beta hydrolase family)
VLDTLDPARRRFLVATTALVVAVVSGLAGVFLALAREGTDPVSPSRLGPVVVVPGYGGGTELLDGLLRAVKDRGREAVLVPPVDGNTGDLDRQAARLAVAVEEVLDRTGARSVDVVGYSAGGVVARLWVRDHGGDDQARRVLTVGSPHHGTDLALLGAVIGCPVACEQLTPDGRLLSRLNSGDETPPGVLWASVWTTEDRTVVPPDSADLRGALAFTVQSVCPEATTSHTELPGDPVVIASLDSVLGTGRPRPPTGVGCAA